MRQSWLTLVLVGALALPGAAIRILEPGFPVAVETIFFGIAVLAVAFLLTWTAEAAETEISRGIAVALLALIAVLPEYAIDIYFAWSAVDNPENAAFAAANMTGGNRLLIGIGWSMVVLLLWARTGHRQLRLGKRSYREILFLTVATAWSFSIPLRRELSLLDSAVLISMFLAYLISSRGGDVEGEEIELVEPAKSIGALPRTRRRILLLTLFVYAAGMILLVAEPFAEGLIHSGESVGIDEFLLVQWVAPLASEAPELIIAGILVMRYRANVAMATLISSKVNQWTLLVGSLPVAYAISGGFTEPLPLDSRQVEEIFLTSAQSIFAISLLANLRMSNREGMLLLTLFLSQLLFTDPTIRYVYAYTYLVLAAIVMFGQRREVIGSIRTRGAHLPDHEPELRPMGAAPPEPH